MSERTLNAVLTVKDVLKQYKHNPEYVPIMKNLSMARTAHRSYNNCLDEKKRQRDLEVNIKIEEEKIKVKQAKAEQELQKERKTIEQKEKELKHKRQEEERKRKAGDTLLDEANERLTKALQKGSLEEVEVAQALLQGVYRVRKEENQQQVLADNIQ
ncbi:hypothetical protein PR048_011006 [Dryococelus australis]|uniref:Uncharacterized protein n=1 Tax=Dryococelus australis TaxID=614101 RepID=A0ABQ9HKK6_9NEOP|nr:hypothetical protein PR048_011006 [Dryococelus australis]